VARFSKPLPTLTDIAWYAVRVRSNFEQVTATALRSRGVEEFLPVTRARRRWSDRTKYIDQPLFPGYVFCRFIPAYRTPVLDSPGVINIVGFGSRLAPIPEEEIQAVRAMVSSTLPVFPHPFLKAGQKIRLKYGPLAGADGIVVEVRKQFRLVASLSLLQRSVSVEIDREWIFPIS
jgi:transcription antitermination factor NusG